MHCGAYPDIGKVREDPPHFPPPPKSSHQYGALVKMAFFPIFPLFSCLQRQNKRKIIGGGGGGRELVTATDGTLLIYFGIIAGHYYNECCYSCSTAA